MSALRKAFAFAGAKVLRSLGAADREIAHYCKVNKVRATTPPYCRTLSGALQCFGILSQDSDYFVLDVCRYLPLDSFKPREKGKLTLSAHTVRYRRPHPASLRLLRQRKDSELSEAAGGPAAAPRRADRQ